jgi:DNA invertase Pin-like site-specific DNA recombinase
MNNQFICYYRVSTDSQRASGLGLDAQRESVERYLTQTGGVITAQFTEVESGKKNDRPELAKAIKACKKHKARLIVAKFDRLARNAAFLLTLRDSGVDFLAADMPGANKLTVGIMAVFAEHERDMISQRTKDALAQARKRGVKLGNPRPQAALSRACQVVKSNASEFAANLAPVIKEIQASGVTTLRGIASVLNTRGFKSPRRTEFSAQTVGRILERSAIQKAA